MSLLLLVLIFSGIISYLLLEKYFHDKRLKSIKTRIHVNGTRGKTSVTRLIAAGIRNGGFTTIAKTSGSDACIIFNNGEEVSLPRGIQPNIIEQVKIVKEAFKRKAEVLVIECMALRPDLQSFCELNLIKSTHGVITNVGPDHLDVMGPDVIGVANALSGSIPVNSKLYSNEEKLRGLLTNHCEDRKSSFIPIPQFSLINEHDMQGFRYVEHPENVALALQVCESLGVDKQTALKGMWESKIDIGAMTIHSTKYNSKNVIFVNGFGANDPFSTKKCWELLQNRFYYIKTKVLLICCREDRQDRSKQMAEMCSSLIDVAQFIVIGTGVNYFINNLSENNLLKSKTRNYKSLSVEQILDNITKRINHDVLIMGVGNIKGKGFDFLNYFNENEFLLHNYSSKLSKTKELWTTL